MFLTRRLRAVELNLQGIRDRLRNIILDGKNIGNLAVVPFRPEMRFIGYLNELSRDPNAIARSADAAFENRSYSEPLPMVRRSCSLPRKANADVRAITLNSRTLVRALIISSAKPSLKYSFSLSALRFTKGSTAID